MPSIGRLFIWVNNMKNLIAEYIGRSCRSKQNLSDLSGVSSSELEDIMDGSEAPTLEQAYRISIVLNTPIDVLWPNPFEAEVETITVWRVIEPKVKRTR